MTDHKEVFKTLEESLTSLLKTVRGDPWSLLMYQTLIWSFRRWAIYHLTSETVKGPLQDYLWDTLIDLVKQYAPEGLREFGTVWLNPTNVGDRSDSLEQLNLYFILLVDTLDESIQTDDEVLQNLLAEFLDETLTRLLEEWLEGRSEYRIYPTLEESADTFPTARIFTIMQKILEAHVKDAPTAATTLVTPEPTVEQPPAPSVAPVPAAVSEAQISVRSALKFRRTMRNHGRRAHGTEPAAARTRKAQRQTPAVAPRS